MKIEQGMEQLNSCASLLCPVTKTPVLELVLLWPLEIHCPSLSMPTSFRIFRNPSCKVDTSDAMRVTRSQDEKIFRESLSPQCFMCISSCHHILMDLLSCLLITCLCGCHKTGKPRSLGSAAQSRSSLHVCYRTRHWAGSRSQWWQALVTCL